MSGGFQTAVANQPAPAVAGDLASLNPIFTVDAGPGGLVAGPAGAIIGRFCWAAAPADGDNAPSQVSNTGLGPVTGFLFREQQGLITAYLAGSGLTVPQGFGLTLANGGDFWVKNDGATQALPGATAYATLADGKVTFGALTGSATGSIAAGSSSFTGSISGDTLTVTGSVTGTIYPGTVISGSGVASGTKIVRQLTGTAGGAGTYAVSIPEQSVAATAITGAYGIFTAASGLSGTFSLGSILTGTGISVTTTITAFGTGSGGLGTYIVDVNTVVSSTTITGTLNVATKWKAMSAALPGELVKISDHLLG